MLHGQAFTSANWLESETIQTFAAAGYRVVAVDLPGNRWVTGILEIEIKDLTTFSISFYFYLGNYDISNWVY